ncbi:hypothetical protein [Gordonia caeni]|uniref:Uncharacterized protein n=1 Tax=Gordonia caeni TaxID=1007097 RepID=A0ABP7NT66_9ACTN
MNALLAHIEQRAEAMPWLAAVRFDGQVITYGDLRERVGDYDPVTSRQGLSANAALSAALVSFLPDSVRALEPADQAAWISQSIIWLSRGLDDSSGPLSSAV